MVFGIFSKNRRCEEDNVIICLLGPRIYEILLPIAAIETPIK